MKVRLATVDGGVWNPRYSYGGKIGCFHHAKEVSEDYSTMINICILHKRQAQLDFPQFFGKDPMDQQSSVITRVKSNWGRTYVLCLLPYVCCSNGTSDTRLAVLNMDGMNSCRNCVHFRHSEWIIREACRIGINRI